MSTYEDALEDLCFRTHKVRLRVWGESGWDSPFIAPFPPLVWESFEERGIGFIWPYVLGAMLKISTLAQMRLVCKEWNEIMRKNNDIWRDVFVRTLRGFEIEESCGQALDEDALILIEEGLDWITLVKEAFTTPFVGYQDDVYNSNSIGMNQEVYQAMQQYRKAGGVINWTFFKPHKIWAGLYKNSLPTYLHKIAVIIAVAGSKFKIETNLRPLLWDNDWERQPKNKLEKWGNVDISEMNRMEPALIDLIDECAKPPYGIRFAMPGQRPIAEARIRDHIYSNSYDNVGIDWIPSWKSMSTWAPLWKSGREWWGCYCHSHYVRSDELLVVSTASATD